MVVVLCVLAMTAAKLAVERSRPGRVWPAVPAFLARAIALNLVQVGAVFLAGWTWDRWMVRVRPWSTDALGFAGGAVVGYVVITFVYYWWHRARHAIPFADDRERALRDMLAGRDVNAP